MHIYMYTYILIYIYTFIHIYIYTFIQIYIYTYIHIYIYTYIHIYIYTYIHIHIYICTYYDFICIYLDFLDLPKTMFHFLTGWSAVLLHPLAWQDADVAKLVSCIYDECANVFAKVSTKKLTYIDSTCVLVWFGLIWCVLCVTVILFYNTFVYKYTYTYTYIYI